MNENKNAPALIARIAEVTGFEPGIIETLRDTIAKDATPEELQVFSLICKRTGLDPFSKQIYFMKTKQKTKDASGQWVEKDVMTVMTGIDGYRAIAERSGTLAGIDDVVYDQENKEFPNKATVTVWRMLNGTRVGFTASARWTEYARMYNGKATGQWAKMPYLMLGKCAEALALRKAFPNDLSGVYTAEEMDQAKNEEKTPHNANARVVDNVEVVAVTQNGNPRGTISDEQMTKIHAQINEIGTDAETANQFTTERFGVRISGLSKEQAHLVIDAFEKKIASMKVVAGNQAGEPKVDPEFTGEEIDAAYAESMEAEGAAIQHDQMTK